MRALALLLLLPACAAEQPAPSDGGMPDDLSAADLAATDLAGAASDLQPYPDPLAGTGAATQAPGSGTYQFTEGPVWLSRGVLLFSDIPANRIYEYDPLAQMVVPFRDPSGNANGLAIDGAGRLYACEGGQRRVTRTDGAVTPIASTFNGQPFNQPNDVIVRSDGTVYFTDPNYTGQPGSQPKERVYRLTGAATPAAALTVVDDTLARPNGIALSPDERFLYVNARGPNRVMRFAIEADGSLGPAMKLIDLPGSPDGMGTGHRRQHLRVQREQRRAPRLQLIRPAARAARQLHQPDVRRRRHEVALPGRREHGAADTVVGGGAALSAA